MKAGEVKSDQKYFAKQMKKSRKPQKIIMAVGKLFNSCTHSWLRVDLLRVC